MRTCQYVRAVIANCRLLLAALHQGCDVCGGCLEAAEERDAPFRHTETEAVVCVAL
jgi:hypothetical protein